MKTLKLQNGNDIPAIGFGCYNPSGADFYPALRRAIDNGYRFFDTASLYGTEQVTGKALLDSGLKREEFFVQSKLWIDEMGYDNTFKALDRTLDRLQMDYLDVYLIHWPRAAMEYPGVPGHPEIAVQVPKYTPNPDWKTLQQETYRALEELVSQGKIRGIGLSNFLPHHLMNILDHCTIRPVVDQLELHLGYTQNAAVRFAQEQSLVVEAWSPLARGAFFQEPFVMKMAEKYGVTVTQLGLRFLVQSQIVPMPKASSDERQKLNLDIFDFEIEPEDYYMLACMPQAYWTKQHPDFALPGAASPK